MNNPSCPVYDDGVCPELLDDEYPAEGHEVCCECGHKFTKGETVNHTIYGSVEGTTCKPMWEYYDSDMEEDFDESVCGTCEHDGECEDGSYHEPEFDFIMCDHCAHDRALLDQMGVPNYLENRTGGNILWNIYEHLSEIRTDGRFRKHIAIILWKILRPLKKRRKENEVNI